MFLAEIILATFLILTNLNLWAKAYLNYNQDIKTLKNLINKDNQSEQPECKTFTSNDKTIKICQDNIFVQNGFTVVELSVKLIILSVISLTLLPQLNLLNKNSKNLKEKAEKIRSFLQWEYLIQDSVKEIQSARLISQLPVFDSEPKYFNQEKIKLKNPPNTQSSSFAGLKFYTSMPLRIIKKDNKKSICYSDYTEKLPSSFDALAISDSYLTEVFVSAEFKKNSNNKICADITMEKIKSIFSDSPFYHQDTVFLLHPIKERFIYYLDKNGTLRRVQLQKNTIIEQQPAANKIHPIKISYQVTEDINKIEILENSLKLKKQLYHNFKHLSLVNLVFTR